ncbi:tetratricopeptide repeat protein [Phenylobacterium sp.]|uniref:O-linked N-acetylglucosamine transferase, SPINDLY family protein n=1 Tax=Phenylobacterium sp. TaxID=1871053 RepID=UPI002811D1B7|nr:tetratricopeptide repeat protein [Phenylobacterium sp.]
MSAAGRVALLAADTEAALAAFTEAVARDPGDFEARYGLAAALMQAGEPADDVLNDARTLQALAVVRGAGADLARLKSDPDYGRRTAMELYAQHHVACASVVWGMALGAGRIDAAGLLSYALSLQHQGRIGEAIQYLQVAVENFPSAALHQFLLFPQLFVDGGERAHAQESRAWAARWARAPEPPPFQLATDERRRLRIGYVAPSFATSQVRQFLAPVLEAHDPARVEVTLYPADAATETGWPDWIKVRAIGELSDEAAATMMRADGIDVLSDCWGHTAGSRLGVFACRPAPVQIAWINFIQTTGLPQIDYILHADGAAALDLSGLFTERLWPIGPVFAPFQPATDRLPPTATPARTAGVVTLGSFNHPAKMSDGALAAWATVLRNAPQTRLMLKYRYFIDPVLQSVTAARFAAHGVAPERLIFSGHSTGEEYYRAFRAVDLMLDGWPAPGSTTTLEAMSNGVPVLSLAGATLQGFYARSMLEAAGLEDLAADTPQDFVGRALALVADLDRLDALRERVRPGFEAGPCCDGPSFTRRLEDAFFEMLDRSRGNSVLPGAA